MAVDIAGHAKHICKEGNMKVICQYCLKYIRGDKNDPVISHGSCRKCFKKAMAYDKWEFIKNGIGKPVTWVKIKKGENHGETQKGKREKD